MEASRRERKEAGGGADIGLEPGGKEVPGRGTFWGTNGPEEWKHEETGFPTPGRGVRGRKAGLGPVLRNRDSRARKL